MGARPGPCVRTRVFRLFCVVLTVAPPLAACGAQETETAEESVEQITVLVDGSDQETGQEDFESVTVRTGAVDSFDDHPHHPEGLTIDVSHPEFEGAQPFTEELAAQIDQEVQDFRAGTREPVSLGIGWQITAAASGVLGVRLIRTEEDMHGLRQGYATYWYDAENGHTAYSTELLADHEALVALNDLVRQQLAGDERIDPAALQPVLRTYDSMGFNHDGDLVVEFDDGHLSPIVEGHVPSTEPGRIAVVIDSEQAGPLLSGLGERVQEASLAEEHEFTVQEPDPEAEGAGIVPGVPRADDPGADCHDGATRCIALTFDDGPHENTPELLDLLAEEGVTATFFLNGDPSLARPSVFRRAYAEGHEIAGHNDHHEHMPETYSGKELTAEVAAVGAMVRRQTGHTIQLFRPPFGASSDEVLAEIGEQDMAEVLWNIDSQDWRGRTPDEIVMGVVDSAGPNAIVLLHDPLEQTLEAMPELIARLRALDYEFVTVSEAIGGPIIGESYPPGGLVGTP